MFIGHFAVGFAARRFAPRTPFALLLLAPLVADVLWPVFTLTGIEHARIVPGPNPFLYLSLDDYPWSHSLLLDAVWAVLLGLVALRFADRGRGFVVVAIGVLSHWVLDFISHTPDMPLYPGSAEYGLSLWRSPTGIMVLESLLFIAGLALYLGATRAKSRAGHVSLWSLALLLAIAYGMSPWNEPPPGMKAVAVLGLVAVALTIAWAMWIDRTRETVAAAAPAVQA